MTARPVTLNASAPAASAAGAAPGAARSVAGVAADSVASAAPDGARPVVAGLPADSAAGAAPGAAPPASSAAAGAVDAVADWAEHRPMLLGLAYRLLGSVEDAEDVLQDAYLRWLRTDRAAVREPRRYLSRTVTRLAVDQLAARHRTVYVGDWLPEPVDLRHTDLGPADTAEARDTLAVAMLHLMERLTPPERAVYVLRTAFDLPYEEIADTVGRSLADCRQLHHRAAERVAGDRHRFAADPGEHRRLLETFVAAARGGDLPRLRALLADQVVSWSDSGGKVRAARNPLYGPAKVARFFAGIYGRLGPDARILPLSVNGAPALLVTGDGGRHVLAFDVADGRIANVYLVYNPDKLDRFLHSSAGVDVGCV